AVGCESDMGDLAGLQTSDGLQRRDLPDLHSLLFLALLPVILGSRQASAIRREGAGDSEALAVNSQPALFAACRSIGENAARDGDKPAVRGKATVESPFRSGTGQGNDGGRPALARGDVPGVQGQAALRITETT